MAPSEIIPNFLFLGGKEDAEDFNTLIKLGIFNVINVSVEIPCYFQNWEEFSYAKIPARDTLFQDLKQFFHSAIEFIGELDTYKYILQNISHEFYFCR